MPSPTPAPDQTALEKTIKAQQKTIEVLMDTVERQAAEGGSTLKLLSHNVNLERVVQLKTDHLRQQGEELKKALRELQNTQAQLIQAKKLESVGQMAAGIAHEINTPAQFVGSNIEFFHDSFADISALMSSVIDIMQTLEQGAATQATTKVFFEKLDDLDWEYLSEEIPSAIRQSQEGIRRITSIVQAMKEFSHPSSKEKVNNDLNRLIETTVIVATNEWKYVAEVRKELDPSLPSVKCLADELGQVFLNILVNAAHAIESSRKGNKQQPKGLITISTRQVGERAEIRISDNGCGIPEEIQSRIFDPFFTTKGVGKGTGQGLAIAHDVITGKHQGEILLESTPGKGTTFILLLPLQ